ncbi:MAG: hypothetical protein KatS3mg111_4229 [Pirellulaceae bacterium]|nr:MAG: hypothetical protein KatS3mg111_4229 [Pirellulaceae bacterium]
MFDCGVGGTSGRFALLHHTFLPSQTGNNHWDLMFDQPDGLLTFRLLALPVPSDPRQGHRVTAVRLPTHRRKYLEYEGPLSGQRGHVQRVAGGTYHAKKQDLPHQPHVSWQVDLRSPQLDATLILPVVSIHQTCLVTAHQWCWHDGTMED